MKRRDFFKQTGLAAIATGINLPAGMSENTFYHKPRLLKPARLKEGATVALIAPASPFLKEKYEKALSNFSNFGFKIVEGKNLHARNGYLAGTDDLRLADLHWAFSDPAVDAVWCIRGGYGCSRLLPSVDYELIRQNPKPFIGYSDVTALHMAIHARTGLVTFHGPVAVAEFPENTRTHFMAALMQPVLNYTVSIPSETTSLPGEEFHPFVIAPGKATGNLTGGNLSLLAALTGTPFTPFFGGKIVFIEEVGEQPYRVDRMLTQLLQATDLQSAAGIVLGVFLDCKSKGDAPSLSLRETLQDRLGALNIPVLYGIPFGHVDHQVTFPYGVRAEMDTEKGTLTLPEAGVD